MATSTFPRSAEACRLWTRVWIDELSCADVGCSPIGAASPRTIDPITSSAVTLSLRIPERRTLLFMVTPPLRSHGHQAGGRSLSRGDREFLMPAPHA